MSSTQPANAKQPFASWRPACVMLQVLACSCQPASSPPHKPLVVTVDPIAHSSDAGQDRSEGYICMQSSAFEHCTASDCDTRFRLFSTDAATSYDQTQTLDKAVWYPDFACLTYQGLRPSLRYSFEIISPTGDRYAPITDETYDNIHEPPDKGTPQQPPALCECRKNR